MQLFEEVKLQNRSTSNWDKSENGKGANMIALRLSWWGNNAVG